MKKLSIYLASLTLFSASTLADDFDYDAFVKAYYHAEVMTQQPNATKEDLEHYLSFLTEDVGNQHFPNAPDDSREPNGKAMMRKGMTYYLGVHTKYKSELIDYQYGYNAVSIKHKFSAKGKRADGSEFSYSKIALDVLELENGKVSVIRRYSE
ncbi:nuclear transport factor 2 family protein [Rheinheimera baltica]|uniref:nuclear transport factor 2 family protein n=1 Tax=Rheinheimera baltica TaxID=67576 RepID=UPI00273E0B34|nr:nuclear transport factor 2 family protein [Rheinheimera baltica]MDP5142197.1 nuclear transport factor 2 family protein [Rheinheimera baltica]MDP5150898.1 nuclear transport factor 2 family protein [Rheinheimera baltica]